MYTTEWHDENPIDLVSYRFVIYLLIYDFAWYNKNNVCRLLLKRNQNKKCSGN